VNVTSLTTNATDSANTILLGDAVFGASELQITIDQFARLNFQNKTNLVLNGGLSAADQGDTIYVNYHSLAAGLQAAIINGGAGNEVIRVFAARPEVAHTINGNAGDDLIAIRTDMTIPFTINGRAGNDTVYGGAGNDVIDGGTGSNILRAEGGNATIYSNGVDVIYTGNGRVTVNGGAGQETVFGGTGDD